MWRAIRSLLAASREIAEEGEQDGVTAILAVPALGSVRRDKKKGEMVSKNSRMEDSGRNHSLGHRIPMDAEDEKLSMFLVGSLG